MLYGHMLYTDLDHHHEGSCPTGKYVTNIPFVLPLQFLSYILVET